MYIKSIFKNKLNFYIATTKIRQLNFKIPCYSNIRIIEINQIKDV